MSLPTLPTGCTHPSREEVLNRILSSIAYEELGLSHILNSEGEKIQYALGTIEGITGPTEPVPLEKLLELNESVRNTIDSATMNQMILNQKMHGALKAPCMQGPTGPADVPRGPNTAGHIRALHKIQRPLSPLS